MSFSVDLEVFRGPLDLLLFLVRRHELDVEAIALSRITDQFLEHLSVLEQLDPDAAGEFLEVAGLLVEMKSRRVLPREEEQVDVLDDPKEELVQRLLEYKRYKDAAAILDDQSRAWQERYTRLANDLPSRRADPAQAPIHEVEIWDLVSAFGRVLRDNHPPSSENIVYDDTPIQVYMQRIHDHLQEHGRMAFSEMFTANMHKSAMIGVFLAILELVRHHAASTKQDQLHGEIWITPDENFDQQLDLTGVDNYEGASAPASTLDDTDSLAGHVEDTLGDSATDFSPQDPTRQ